MRATGARALERPRRKRGPGRGAGVGVRVRRRSSRCSTSEGAWRRVVTAGTDRCRRRHPALRATFSRWEKGRQAHTTSVS
ncbi:hypothetical protein D0A38_15420 [Xanthomonas campestris pv. incanae]|nr:hypothetical protein D0A38_15420 [Xanthomonas campestris pv. incanae]